MFRHANRFNIDISQWNVENVLDMSEMFFFNKDDGNNADGFNQDLSNWLPSAVTSMKSMFAFQIQYNQPINWPLTNSLLDTYVKITRITYSHLKHENILTPTLRTQVGNVRIHSSRRKF